MGSVIDPYTSSSERPSKALAGAPRVPGGQVNDLIDDSGLYTCQRMCVVVNALVAC